MCQINNSLCNTGDKPLICYKVLLRDSKCIISPYYKYCLWELGETKRSKQLCFNRSYIGSGFFHAFTNKEDADREQAILTKLDLILTRYPYSYIIAEMEIPPHTDYYIGVTENGIDSIATPVITFKQIL